MAEYGSLDGFVVNVAPGKYQHCIISGNQKHKHADLNSAKIEFSERYKKPTASGTVAIGRVLFEGEWFPYREVYWSDEKCEIGNLRANNYGGHNDPYKLSMFSPDVLTFGGVDLDFESAVFELRNNDEPTKIKSEPQTHELKYYEMTHILLSFPPHIMTEIQDKIEQIIKTPGVEYEQSSNGQLAF